MTFKTGKLGRHGQTGYPNRGICAGELEKNMVRARRRTKKNMVRAKRAAPRPKGDLDSIKMHRHKGDWKILHDMGVSWRLQEP